MRSFRRHFTTANLLSVEVILISTAWAVFANLTDPLTSGVELTISRLSIVIIMQVLLFASIWLSDHIFIKKIDKKFQPFVLLLTLFVFAIARGYILGQAFFVIGITPEAIIGPRLVASLTNQGILVALLTVSYGLISQSAELRQTLLAKRNQLEQLVTQVGKSNETQNMNSVERVRIMLRRALELDEEQTPEETLNILRDSIDEVVRPFSRTLFLEATQIQIGDPKQKFKVNWIETLRETLDVRSIQIFPTFILFFLIGLGPSSQLFSFQESLRLYLLVSSSAIATFLILKALARRFLPAQQPILGFPILLVSVTYGALATVWIIPEDLVTFYLISWYGLMLFTGFVPAFVYVALKQSNLLSAQIQVENEDLEWELARARAAARQYRQAVSTALHGNVQATLSAAALQLQRAINAQEDIEQALASAKSEAERSIDFTVDFNKPPVPVQTTILEVTELWRGVAYVNNKLSLYDINLINSDPICARTVNELIVELCMNAVKHANAGEITISGNWVNDREFELLVSNDFISEPQSENDPGIGTNLLEELSLDWNRGVVNDSFVVTARLPWQSNSH